MKKELNEFLKSENAILAINRITFLYRWQKDGLGNPVDRLTVEFDSPTGRVSFYTEEIEAREPHEIIEAVKTATEHFAEKWLEETLKQLDAGRINGHFQDLT